MTISLRKQKQKNSIKWRNILIQDVVFMLKLTFETKKIIRNNDKIYYENEKIDEKMSNRLRKS